MNIKYIQTEINIQAKTKDNMCAASFLFFSRAHVLERKSKKTKIFLKVQAGIQIEKKRATKGRLHHLCVYARAAERSSSNAGAAGPCRAHGPAGGARSCGCPAARDRHLLRTAANYLIAVPI